MERNRSDDRTIYLRLFAGYGVVTLVGAAVLSLPAAIPTGPGLDPPSLPTNDAWTFASRTVILWATAIVLMIPAFVTTVESLSRFYPASAATRSLLGGLVWATWFAVLAISGWLISKIVLLPELMFPALALVASAGAGFAWIAARQAPPPRPGNALWIVSVVDAMLLLCVAVIMAGRWGAAT